MDKIIELIIAIGSPAILLAILIFAGKNIIEYFFKESIEVKKLELSQTLESFKHQNERSNRDYQHQLNQNLEEYKSKIDLMQQEFNIQFSHLHNERANVIKTLYGHLVELQSSMFHFTRTFIPVIDDAAKEEEERVMRAQKALNDVINFFLPNRIFLSVVLAEKVENLIQQYRTHGYEFGHIRSTIRNHQLPKEYYKTELEKLNTISDVIRDEMPQLVAAVGAEFRQVLGVKEV